MLATGKGGQTPIEQFLIPRPPTTSSLFHPVCPLPFESNAISSKFWGGEPYIRYSMSKVQTRIRELALRCNKVGYSVFG